MKILALGNSFSEDCTAYLEQMTEGALVRNLYIGGCSLERHAANLRGDVADYELQKDGRWIGERHVSANEILLSDAWDVITVQQVSQLSGMYETHGAHLAAVLAFLRALCPTACIVWNQTWAYATYSTHGGFVNYGGDRERMHEAIDATAHRVARENDLGIIETGRAIAYLRRKLTPDGTELCRDGFHLSFDYGRYAAAYTWAKYFALQVSDFVPTGADGTRIREIRDLLDNV
ncbi:MAG: DUF4886 domain-containing protein [Ruminococcaceae bacterium]|nr:DUF4886 domain-containing protein [Oscillospiraceae bacterium]